MTDAYRRKLLDWWISMMLILLNVVSYSLYYWFARLPWRMQYMEGIDEVIFTLANSIEFYGTLFVPIFVWHLGEFSSGIVWKRRFARVLFSHNFMVLLLVLHGFAALFVASDLLNDLFCPEIHLPEGHFQFDGCGSWTPDWKLGIWAAIWLTICVTAIVKLSASIFAYSKKKS